ncbi:MAG TPA: hypothetical protein VFO21_02145 [Vicinamibacterales bacterium]|nr:hypothetical protein [Vicinamibacterales bacterium]
MLLRRLGFVLAFCLVSVNSALAQNWSFDARSIALGDVSGKSNLASRMVEEQRRYRTIVIPLGLFQVLRNFDTFKPESEEFDFVRAIEYAASPLHYQFGRDQESESGRELFTDIRSATLSRDLSDYRGYELANQPVAEGLANPSWGATIRVSGDRGGPFHGVYVGAGPYLSMRALGTIDDRVIDILASEDPLRFPNTQYRLESNTQGQIAMAITGGYRGRFEIANPGSDRDGIYAAVNFNYLRGFRYEAADADLRLDTDGAGLLTINPLLPSPLAIVRTAADSGRGFAIDVGVAAVLNGFEVGFGVNGIANRINWTNAEQTTYLLGNLFLGQDDFVEGGPFPASDVRVELPKDYHVNGGYHADSWSVMSEYAHGFQGDSLRGGAEYRAGLVELRGGAVYSREMWNPTGGVGLNLSPRVGVDVALYSTAANAARERRAAFAVSLRINAL